MSIVEQIKIENQNKILEEESRNQLTSCASRDELDRILASRKSSLEQFETTHYICEEENGEVIMYNAYNIEPVPFAFIEADFK